MDDFVTFAAGTKKIKSLIVFDPDEKNLEEPKPMPPLPFPRWQAVHGDASLRLELVGDSKVITNWMNGCWPVNNPAYSSSVNDCIDLLHDLSVRNVLPRAQHAQWIRHVLRGYNEDANTLATRGKNLEYDDCHLEIEWMDIEKIQYVQGFWDGGYSPGSEHVGVGFLLKYATEPPSASTTWINWCRGFGRCHGTSAIQAELVAFKCLLTTFSRLLTRQNFWEPLLPWASWYQP